MVACRARKKGSGSFVVTQTDPKARKLSARITLDTAKPTVVFQYHVFARIKIIAARETSVTQFSTPPSCSNLQHTVR